jgi:hypothetical protein
MVIHPDKGNKGHVVSVCFVCAIKHEYITKCFIINLTLKVTPQQSYQMPSPIGLVLEKEIRIVKFALCHVTDYCLSITDGKRLLLKTMAEIVKVP